MVKVDAAQKDQLDRQIAVIWTRLITVDCLEEARALGSKNLGAGMRAAGEALGTTAVAELLGNKEAEGAMGTFGQYLHDEDFKALRP